MNTKNTLHLFLAVIIVIFGAIFFGTAAGKQDTKTLSIFVAGFVVLGTFIALKQNIWIIIPIFAMWSGRVSVLPLPFAVSNLAVGFAVVSWLLFLATRRQVFTLNYSKFDIFLGMLVVLLIAGYFRNPVGLASIGGGSNVGARPYVECIIAFMGYLMLSNQQADSKMVARLPSLHMFSAFLIAGGGAVAFLVPGAGLLLYQIYSGFLPNVATLFDPYGDNSDAIGRTEFIRPFALGSVALIGGLMIPFKVLQPKYFWYGCLLFLAGVLALLSGYRSSLVAIVFYFVFGSWLWLGLRGVLVCAVGGSLVIFLLVVLHQFVPLPERAQRPLSFLPGNWDEKVIQTGKDSNEWRFEMWEIVIEGDTIKNWWIGDGFGFPKAELEYFGAMQQSGNILPEQLAEYFIITGGLHSGPLSAIKYVGVIGLVIFMIIATLMVLSYIKLWNKCRYWGVDPGVQATIGFYAIFAAYIPLKYIFIFGAFDSDLPIVIVSLGIYRLLEKVVLSEIEKIKAEPSALAEGDDPVLTTITS